MNREQLRASLEEHFGSLEDPRVERTRAHLLMDIIAIALMGVLSGADGWVGIETYGKAKRQWLETFLALPNGIPSHDTFARVFARLDPDAFEASFQTWVAEIVSALGGQVIALDGKCVRGSYDREGGQKALQLVTAWASAHQLVLGQCAVDSKSNEITAIPMLLEQLDLSGTIVSIDAMGTQTAIAAQIQNQQADYILALKGNHPTLNQQARAWFDSLDFEESSAEAESGYTHHQTTESGHHRIESRHLWQVSSSRVFDDEQCRRWPGLRSLVVVRSERQLWNKDSSQVRFFLSSLDVDARTFAGYVRQHWGIENQLHWCLDVVFREDASRIRSGHAPRNMSLLRRLALNLLRQEPSKASLTMKRYRAGLEDRFMLDILSAGLAPGTA